MHKKQKMENNQYKTTIPTHRHSSLYMLVDDTSPLSRMRKIKNMLERAEQHACLKEKYD